MCFHFLLCCNKTCLHHFFTTKALTMLNVSTDFMQKLTVLTLELTSNTMILSLLNLNYCKIKIIFFFNLSINFKKKKNR